MYQQAEYARSFMFHFFVVVLFAMMPVSQVMCNRLHDIIKKHVDNYAVKREKESIKEDFLSSTTASFCQIIKETPELVLQADENGFLPIDLLILEIKKLGKDGVENCGNNMVQATAISWVLIQALADLSKAMITQGSNLHTDNLRVTEIVYDTSTGTTVNEYKISPLGFLLSPVAARKYIIETDHTLKAGQEGLCELSLLELMAFAHICKEEVIKQSIDWKRVKCLDAMDRYGATVIQSTPLHSAVRSGSSSAALKLLDAVLETEGLDSNAPDGLGYTPLMRALYTARVKATSIQQGYDERPWPHSEAFKKILACPGIPLNEQCKASCGTAAGQTLLEVAVYYGFVEATENLLDKGAKAEVSGARNGKTLCDLAIESPNFSLSLEALDKVISKYSDFAQTAINKTNSTGDTPLHRLLNSQKSNKENCKKFLDYGADITAPNKKGQTPLHLVGSRNVFNAAGGQNNVLGLFVLFKEHAEAKKIDFAALVNTKDENGDTPLHYLLNSPESNTKICEKFLDYGADITAPNKKGQTPLHLVGRLIDPHDSNSQAKALKLFELFKQHAKNKKIDFTALVNTKDFKGDTLQDLVPKTGYYYTDFLHHVQNLKENNDTPAPMAASESAAEQPMQSDALTSVKPSEQNDLNVDGVQPVKDDRTLAHPAITDDSSKSTILSFVDAPSQPRNGDPFDSSKSSRQQSPLKSTPSLTEPASQGVFSHTFMKGALAITVGTSLLFMIRKLFKQEKNIKERSVDQDSIEGAL